MRVPSRGGASHAEHVPTQSAAASLGLQLPAQLESVDAVTHTKRRRSQSMDNKCEPASSGLRPPAQPKLFDVWAGSLELRAERMADGRGAQEASRMCEEASKLCEEPRSDQPCRGSRSIIPAAAPTAKGQECEDPRHSQPLTQAGVLRVCEDGVLRCKSCCAKNRRSAATVGTRGLKLKAYFRNRRGCNSIGGEESPSTASTKSPEDMSEGAKSSSDELTKSPASDITAEPKTASWQEQESASIPDGDGVPWLGCDKCPRWYMVDGVLYDHWKDSPFSCASISERCAHAPPSNTALVHYPDAEGVCSRAGSSSARASLPAGCWDIYPSGADLPWPAGESKSLDVFAAPVGAASEAVRLQAEGLLCEAFPCFNSRASIVRLLGLHDGGSINLRSGRKPKRSRIAAVAYQRWLIWETLDDEMVGAAILSKQVRTKVGPAHLRGGAVLEYIACKRHQGGAAHLLISAASQICRLLGLKEIFSACDLSQEGQAFKGQSCRALDAHRRWGFVDMDQEEWHERRFVGYTRESSVHFMVKTLGV